MTAPPPVTKYVPISHNRKDFSKPVARKHGDPALFDMPLGSSGDAGWHGIQDLPACPHRYKLKAVMKIRRRGLFVPEPLAIGALLHAMRAQWLYDNRSESSIWEEQAKVYRDRLKDNGEIIMRGHFEAALRDFEGYVIFWRTRPFPKTLAIEYLISPRGITPGAPAWAFRSGRFDSVSEVRYMGKTGAAIDEAKSTSKGAGSVNSKFKLHGQTLTYAALWGPEETAKFGPLLGISLDPILKAEGMKLGSGAYPRPFIPLDRLQHALSWFRKMLPQWIMQASSIQWNDFVEHRTNSCEGCHYAPLCTSGRDGAIEFVYSDPETGEEKKLLDWKPSKGREVPPWA